MEEFIEYIKMLINTMGFKVFEPIVKEDTTNIESEELFIKGARGADAIGKRVSDGFVVFKNSEVALDTVPSFPKGFSSLREELIASELIETVIKRKESL